MKPSLSVAAVVLSLLVLPAAGRAQEHAAPAPTLDAIATSHAASSGALRAELRAFLQRSEVREIAEHGGVDIETAQAAVEALSAEELSRLSGRLTEAQAALAGGDTLVISSTTIIIVLLILIIILVA